MSIPIPGSTYDDEPRRDDLVAELLKRAATLIEVGIHRDAELMRRSAAEIARLRRSVAGEADGL